MGYIKVPKVYRKLKKAEEFYAPVIMTAAVGSGKSAAVEYYFRRKNPLVLHCEGGNITEMPSVETFRSSTVIIEDMQWLSEKESIQYLKSILQESGIQVVMLTRGAIPKFLASESIQYGFVHIQEKDFAFGEREVEAYFEEKGIDIHPDDVPLVAEASHGYVLAIFYYTVHMEHGRRYSEQMQEEVWQDLFHLWDGLVYDQWSDEFRMFAMSVSPYDTFSIPMAEYLTGNKQVWNVVEYCRDQTQQLRYGTEGVYSLRYETRKFFLWKRELAWSREEIDENYRRAANYYEMQGDIPSALKYYQKAGATQRVKELLIRNANDHPGTGHYVETREYYFALPREEIVSSPTLIAGMSMLYDLILLPEKSEEWYNELMTFYQDKNNSRDRRREAKTRLAYLDIGLPHKGVKGILGIMRNVFALINKGDIILPEFCATGNMPSIMNGGLDFSEWSKNDRQIAKFMGKPLAVIVGKFGKGLVTLALAESGFEKGTMDAYEVLTRCNDGFDVAAHGGKIEMCFVSVGIQARQHIIEGQLPSAKRIYDSFSEKVRMEGANQLLPNIEAFGVWLSLFSGQNGQLGKYIESVLDARVFFFITDRYRQMMKLRCLIAANRLEEAFDLASFLTGYYESYHRPFMWMENEVLKAVILYRKGDEKWRACLKGVLIKANEHHFVRVISIEGAAVLPLLKKIKDDGICEVDEDYFEQVYEECVCVSGRYPDYLRYIPKEAISLTKRESQVLSMLCAGMSMEEICHMLGISYDGLKKHNRNIYKKLGVKRRAEAERKALQLGLVYRGNVVDGKNSMGDGTAAAHFPSRSVVSKE